MIRSLTLRAEKDNLAKDALSRPPRVDRVTLLQADVAEILCMSSRETMLAGVLHGEHDLKAERVPSPTPRAGQVRLKLRRAGVCGSDVHYFEHGRCGAFAPSRPFILGHEFVADVEQLGAGVQSLEIGQRVVVNPAASCGQCRACKAGRCNLCQRVVMLGSASTTPPTDGAFAEFVVVPAHQCYALPDSMDDGEGAMMEPLCVALHAVNRAGGVAGRTVLVTGGGPIGLLSARAATALGARLVAISEPDAARRSLAIHHGADHALDPASGRFVEESRDLSGGGFDVVFEASGAAAAVRSAMDAAGRGGTIVQIGTVAAGDATLPVNDLMVRELSLLGTFRYSDEFPRAIDLVARGKIDVAPMITGVYPLADVRVALEVACSGGDALKVQIDAA
ncbi:MAG: alcohol dehydrogenase catalytic domain-containing protein [Planctomycetota bacterium]